MHHRTILRALTAIAAVAAFTATARTAAAQSGTISATATVLQPITVTGVQDLSFGNVYPGVAKTVAYTDATNAGQFSVAGYGGAQVTVSFTLPSNLTSGTNTLPIDTWSGYYNQSNSASSGGSAFASLSSATTTTLSATGALYVFLGARVAPTSTQTAGTYTGTVTMTVAYTGA